MQKIVLASALAMGVAFAQSPVSYTASQAAQGKTAFAQACASCHGSNLDDGEFAPPLKGPAFRGNWGGKGADQVFSYMTNRMPPDRPGTLGAEVYTQILAFVFSENNMPAGTAALPSDPVALAKMTIPGSGGPGAGPGGGLSPGVSLPPPPSKNNPLLKMTAVTDTMLANPPAADWLTWRRTYDDQGFSPLKQIDKTNVGDLRVAWTWTLPTDPTKPRRWCTTA